MSVTVAGSIVTLRWRYVLKFSKVAGSIYRYNLQQLSVEIAGNIVSNSVEVAGGYSFKYVLIIPVIVAGNIVTDSITPSETLQHCAGIIIFSTILHTISTHIQQYCWNDI